MEYENQQRRFESVYSTKVRAGKRRTYFFDVRKTKGDDFYITLTESTKRFEGDGYERHKIFLYKEDFNRFLSSLSGAIDHVKTELMPDYDYDEFTRRQEEWEEKRKEMDQEAANNAASAPAPTPVANTQDSTTNYIGETEKNVVTEDVAEAVEEVESAEESIPESVATVVEESKPTNVEEPAPSEVSDETKQVSTEGDEDDMSW